MGERRPMRELPRMTPNFADKTRLSTLLKAAIHVLLFLLAVVVFYLGLGVGLAVNSALGTALWVVALIILVLNVYWICRRSNAS